MEKRERMATYKVVFPVTFEFKAKDDMDIDQAIKIAQNYAEIIMGTGSVEKLDWDKEMVDLVSRETIYTKEELIERQKRFEEIFKVVRVWPLITR